MSEGWQLILTIAVGTALVMISTAPDPRFLLPLETPASTKNSTPKNRE